MYAKNMNLKEMKTKILENFLIEDGDESVKNFDDLCHYGYITSYSHGIKNFPELKWQQNLEKHYNVIIPLKYLINYDIAVQSSENYEEEILENDDNKLVISYHNYGGDWQYPVDFKATIYSDGHSEYDLGSYENDRRDYSHYITEIEAVAKHLNYDITKLTGDQLGYIIENYIDVLLNYLKETDFDTFDQFILYYNSDIYRDNKLDDFMALPLELKKSFFKKIN